MEGPQANALQRFKAHLEETAGRKIKCNERKTTRENLCCNCHTTILPPARHCKSCSMVIKHFDGQIEVNDLGEIVIDGTEQAHLLRTGERVLIRPDKTKQMGANTYILAYRFWQGLKSMANHGDQPYQPHFVLEKNLKR
jgi:hypothetical protein